MVNRNTQQRQAIRDALETADRPLAPQEVHRHAARKSPGLGIATVYRTVKQGVDEGWLAPVDLPGEPRRYEIAGKQHHHHFHCRNCGRVFEVDGCPGNLRPLTPAGFTLEDHEVILYGLCDRCTT